MARYRKLSQLEDFLVGSSYIPVFVRYNVLAIIPEREIEVGYQWKPMFFAVNELLQDHAYLSLLILRDKVWRDAIEEIFNLRKTINNWERKLSHVEKMMRVYKDDELIFYFYEERYHHLTGYLKKAKQATTCFNAEYHDYARR